MEDRQCQHGARFAGTYRGWDGFLRGWIAGHGSHYADADTLRFFDSYAGRTHYVDGDSVALVVESVLPPYSDRLYRLVSFTCDGSGGLDVSTSDLGSKREALRAFDAALEGMRSR